MGLDRPSIYGTCAALLVFLCILVRPKYRNVGRVLYVILGITLIYGSILPAALAIESRIAPWKFDELLYRLDGAMGLSVVSFSRAAPSGIVAAFQLIYRTLVWAITVWAAIHLMQPWGRYRALVNAFLIAYPAAGVFYLIVPACGPTVGVFPGSTNGVLMTCEPNAMPSMHVASALLLVLFAGPNRWLRSFSILYLLGIAGGTVFAGEHYFMDWVVAIPVACFAACAATKQIKAASLYLVFVFSWLFLIRIAGSDLISHPMMLRALVLGTLLSGMAGVRCLWAAPGALVTEAVEARIPLLCPRSVNR